MTIFIAGEDSKYPFVTLFFLLIDCHQDYKGGFRIFCIFQMKKGLKNSSIQKLYNCLV